MEGIEAKVVEVIGNIWSSILGLEIRPIEGAPATAASASAERSLTVCIQVTGSWEGTVLLFSTYGLARRMASIMFDCPLENLNGEDTEDAMGELGNMAAGNIKKALSDSCGISLPAVVDGIDYRLLVPGSEPLCQVLFSCEEQPVVVSLLQKEAQAGQPGKASVSALR